MDALPLAVALVVYNGFVNLWPPFHGWVYVPMNLAVAGIVIGVGIGPLGLSRSEIGFAGGWGSDAALGLLIGMTIAALVVAAALHPRTRRLVADERERSTGGANLAYRALVRIPLGTAFLEEVAFRGVLYAAWRPNGAAVATLLSAASFGLWHVTPTWNLIRANRPSATLTHVVAGIAAAVGVTTVAGVALAAVREATGGLAAPFALHAALNSTSLAGAVLAHRMAGRER